MYATFGGHMKNWSEPTYFVCHPWNLRFTAFLIPKQGAPTCASVFSWEELLEVPKISLKSVACLSTTNLDCAINFLLTKDKQDPWNPIRLHHEFMMIYTALKWRHCWVKKKKMKYCLVLSFSSFFFNLFSFFLFYLSTVRLRIKLNYLIFNLNISLKNWLSSVQKT